MTRTSATVCAFLLFLVVLSPGCSMCGAPDLVDAAVESVVEEVSSDPTPSPGTIQGSQEAPEPFLAEMYVVMFRVRDAYKKRILQDGSVWRYTDRRILFNESSKKVEGTIVPRAWWFDGERLAPSEVRALTVAIRDLGIMLLPMEPPPPTGTLIGAHETDWSFSLDGLTNTVVTLQGQPRPEIDRFERLLDVATDNVIQRWRRDRGLEHDPVVPLPAP
jgi:hypothetical protein